MRSLLTGSIISHAVLAAIIGSVTGVPVGGLVKVRDAREGIGSAAETSPSACS
jgi:hypothetical protein